jgi:hypothetical protein
VTEAELMGLLEREYTLKLSGRLGRADGTDGASGPSGGSGGLSHLVVAGPDYEFMRGLYDAFRQADAKTRQAFVTVCESMLNLPKKASTPVSE